MNTKLTLLLAVLAGAVCPEHYNIVPVGFRQLCQPYPNGTCFTLDQLSTQISDTGDITISFLPGEHLLAWNIEFLNRANITLKSEQLENWSNNTPRIKCVSNTRINIENTDIFTLQGLVICNCQTHSEHTAGGGAIYLMNTTATIKNCVFKNNSAMCKDCAGGALYSTNSKVTIDGCVFSENSASIGGAVYISERLRTVHKRNKAKCGGGVLSSSQTMHISDSIFEHNRAIGSGGGAVATDGGGIISRTFYKSNTAFNGDGGALLVRANWMVEIINSTFEYNSALAGDGGAIAAMKEDAVIIANSTFTSNQALKGGAISSQQQNKIIFDESLTVKVNSNSAHYGGAIYVKQGILQSGSKYSLTSGSTIITNNTAKIAGGGVYAVQSIIHQDKRSIKIHNNTALQDGGGIFLTASSLSIDKSGLYDINSNTACHFGGGIYLQDNSQLLFFFGSKMMLKNNTARRGGAIYVSDSGSGKVRCSKEIESSEQSTFKECFIQEFFFSSLIIVYFENNSATETGKDVYGGLLDRCTTKSNNTGFNLGIDFMRNRAAFNFVRGNKTGSISQFHSHISSDPVKVCFCYDDFVAIDCNYKHPIVFTKKGEIFTLSVVAVDQLGKPVEATIISSLISSSQRIERLREGQQHRQISAYCTELEYNVYSLEPSTVLEIYAEGPCGNQGISKQEVNITFEPCTCPVGLEKTSGPIDCSCDCALELKQYISKCSAENATIQINRNVWIEYINHTNSTSKFIKHWCIAGYCVTKPVNISLVNQEKADQQCAFNRTGRLCGQCPQGFSLVFASSRCQQCSNNYLFLLLPFTLAGIVLVAFILLLNMTVATGTIHGLIFYANILSAKHSFFLRFNNNFLTVFISWLNLNLGIETCFYNGMDSYGKFLLQLVFPAYVFLLIAIIMVLCNRSQRMAKMFGKRNPEATLYTLILLSYSKLTHLIITALQYTLIDYPDGQKVFWLYDANVPYFTPSHVPRFLAAFIIIILGAVYTTLLLFGQLFNRCSEYRFMKWTTHRYYIHFFKAHHAPFTDKHRYWVGLLLLVKLLYYLIASFSHDNVAALSVAVFAFTLTLYKIVNKRVYTNKLIDIFETIQLLNIFVFAIVTYFISGMQRNQQEDGSDQQALATVSLSVSFITFLGVVLYHILDSCGVKLGEPPNKILKAFRECRHNQPVIAIEGKEADNYELLIQHDDDQLREPTLDDLIPVQPEDYNMLPTPPPLCKEPTFMEIDIRACTQDI